MKKMLSVLVASVALLLAGCQPTTEDIQKATQTLCGFVPTAVVIGGFIPGVSDFTTSAGAIATAICTALRTQQLRPTARRLRLATPITLVVTVNGTPVTVTGHYSR